jgi:hypothetical protein
MIEQIRQSVSDRALVIQAPSGAGKSSLLRAGLWRRLRRHAAFSPLAIVRVRQAVLSHEEWGLAAGLAKPEANILNLPLEILEDRVSRDLPQLLAELVDADASRTGGRRTMLLGIDQAEEIAALSAPQELDEYRRLFTGLMQAAGSLDIRLVLTARDDSIDATLDRLARFGITQEAVRTYRLHRMPAPRFKEVIEKPALVATGCGFTVKIDEALSTALAQAAAPNQGEFSDALPILALALQRLVKKRRAPDGSIKAEPDIAARLVSEAVSEAARDAVLEAKADESALRRLMIPRLVTWDPRAGEGGAAKRRVATSNELFEGDRGSLTPLADALVNQRLLTRARDNYEVSHEALLRVAPLGSLVLELRNKFVRADMLTMEAHDWMEYGRRKEWVARTGERLEDAQALVADPDFGPLLSPSKLGISEYLAACDDKDRQERELRERLDRYELANLTAGAQSQHRLSEPTTNAMPGSETVRGDGLKIYISYSRKDVLLSDQISSALMQAGFDVFLDRTDIAAGENWLERIQDMITGADKLVILVSPDSVRSQICRKDLEFAAESGKTLVPVLVHDVPLAELPSDLAKRNIIFMRNEEEFARGMPALAVTLATDLAWVREHTRLQELALLWGRDKNNALLLRGEALTAAERWLAGQPASAPLPTAMQREFIGAAQRARLRRSRTIIATTTSALVLTMMLSALAFWQRGVAVRQAEIAQQQSELANAERYRAEEQRSLAEKLRKRAERSALRAKLLEDALRQVDANNPLLRP